MAVEFVVDKSRPAKARAKALRSMRTQAGNLLVAMVSAGPKAIETQRRLLDLNVRYARSFYTGWEEPA